MRSRAGVASGGGGGGGMPMAMTSPSSSSPSMRAPAPRSRNPYGGAISSSSMSGGRSRRPATPPRDGSYGHGYVGGGRRVPSRRESRSWTSTLCMIVLAATCFAGGVAFSGRGGSGASSAKDPEAPAEGSRHKLSKVNPDATTKKEVTLAGDGGSDATDNVAQHGKARDDDDDDDDAASPAVMTAKQRAALEKIGKKAKVAEDDDDDDDVPSLKKTRHGSKADDDDDDDQVEEAQQERPGGRGAGEQDGKSKKKKKEKKGNDGEETLTSSAAVGRRDLLETRVVPLVDDDDDAPQEQPLVLPGRGPRHSPDHLAGSGKRGGKKHGVGPGGNELQIATDNDQTDPEARNIHNVPFKIPITWETIGDPKKSVKRLARKHMFVRKNLRGDDPPDFLDGDETTTALRGAANSVAKAPSHSTFTKTFGAAASLMGVQPDAEMSEVATSRRKSRTLPPALDTTSKKEKVSKTKSTKKDAKTENETIKTKRDEDKDSAKTEEAPPKKLAPGFPEEEDKLREAGKDSHDPGPAAKKGGAGPPAAKKETTDGSASGRDGADTSSIKNQLKRQTDSSAARSAESAAHSSGKETAKPVEHQIKVQTDADGDAKHHVAITFEEKGEKAESEGKITLPSPPSAVGNGAGAAAKGKLPKLPVEDDDDDDKVGTAKEGIKQQMNHIPDKVTPEKLVAKTGTADGDDDDDAVGLGGGTVGGGAAAVLTEANRGGADTTAKADGGEDKVMKRPPPKQLRNQLGGDTTSENVKLPSDADRATEKERPKAATAKDGAPTTPLTKTA